jgi:Xaa-Pro dipeptidase
MIRDSKNMVAGRASMICVANLRADIENRFAELLNQDYPRFSDAEFERRRKFAHKLCERDDLDAVIIAQSMRAGTATFWFTGWPVTQEAVTVIMPGLAPRMYVQYFNHVPLARKLGVNIDVDWGEDSGLRRAVEFIRTHSPKPPRLGVVGLLSPNQHQQIAATAATIVDANAAYNEMRLVKSAEEIHWLRLGAGLTDLAIASLAAAARPGLSERELGDIVERSYFPLGGTNAIHYFAATPMTNPTCAVPAQFPSTRKLQHGDVLVTEISAQFWEYSGQVLRSFAVDAEPSPLFRELHAVADAAFDAIVACIKPGVWADDLRNASLLIEEAGFTVIDDVVHGYGGGYLPPILRAAERNTVVPKMRLEAGMALVVQPNVTTKDQSAGVQTGHLGLVTATGFESLQQFPRGFHVLGK